MGVENVGDYVDKQKMSHHIMGDHERIKPADHDQANINKHSYFLRAKTPRFNCKSILEDGEMIKKPSSSSFDPDHEHSTSMISEEEEDLANCLVMLSNKNKKSNNNNKAENTAYYYKEVSEKGTTTFQCKACKKVFSSHQALGGHRASHKKVKGCFAAKSDDPINDEENDDSNGPTLGPPEEVAQMKRRPTNNKKMHECSVCRRVFTSGQALGGHKRCHWLTTSATSDTGHANFIDIPSFINDQFRLYSDDRDRGTQVIVSKKAKLPHDQLTYDHDQDKDKHGHGHDHDDNRVLDLNLNLQLLDQNHDGGETSASRRLYKEHEKRPSSCDDKMKKLSEIRDHVKMDGGWLQVGINATSFNQ